MSFRYPFIQRIVTKISQGIAYLGFTQKSFRISQISEYFLSISFECVVGHTEGNCSGSVTGSEVLLDILVMIHQQYIYFTCDVHVEQN